MGIKSTDLMKAGIRIPADPSSPPIKRNVRRGTGKAAQRKQMALGLTKPAAFSGGVVTLWMPLKVISEANRRDNWRAAHARGKAQRVRIGQEFLLARQLLRFVRKPYIVKLTRIGPGDPLDGDNLQRAFKAARDEVAKCLGVDDGDKTAIRFRYSQSVGRQFMVRISISTTTERQGK